MPEINKLDPVTNPAATDVYPVQQADGRTRRATAQQVTFFETQRAMQAEALLIPLSQKNEAGGVPALDDESNLIVGGIVVGGSAGAQPASGDTVQIPDNIETFHVRGNAQLSYLTVVLPVNPISNHRLEIIFHMAVESAELTAPEGYTINNPIEAQTFGPSDRINVKLDGTLWC